MRKDRQLLITVRGWWHDPEYLKKQHDARLEKYGKPSWLKRGWRSYLWMTSPLEPVYVQGYWIFWKTGNALKALGQWLLILSPFILLFGLGLFVGHVLWK